MMNFPFSSNRVMQAAAAAAAAAAQNQSMSGQSATSPSTSNIDVAAGGQSVDPLGARRAVTHSPKRPLPEDLDDAHLEMLAGRGNVLPSFLHQNAIASDLASLSSLRLPKRARTGEAASSDMLSIEHYLQQQALLRQQQQHDESQAMFGGVHQWGQNALLQEKILEGRRELQKLQEEIQIRELLRVREELLLRKQQQQEHLVSVAAAAAAQQQAQLQQHNFLSPFHELEHLQAQRQRALSNARSNANATSIAATSSTPQTTASVLGVFGKQDETQRQSRKASLTSAGSSRDGGSSPQITASALEVLAKQDKVQRQNRKPSQVPSLGTPLDVGSSPQMTASALEVLAKQDKIQRQNRKSPLPSAETSRGDSSPQITASALAFLAQQDKIQRQRRKSPQPAKVETSRDVSSPQITASALEVFAKQDKIQRQNRKPSQPPSNGALHDGGSSQTTASALQILAQQDKIQRQNRKPSQSPSNGSSHDNGSSPRMTDSASALEVLAQQDKIQRQNRKPPQVPSAGTPRDDSSPQMTASALEVFAKQDKIQRQNRKPSQASSTGTFRGGSSPHVTASALEVFAKQDQIQRQNRKPSPLPKTDLSGEGSSPQMTASALEILAQQEKIQRQNRKPHQFPSAGTSCDDSSPQITASALEVLAQHDKIQRQRRKSPQPVKVGSSRDVSSSQITASALDVLSQHGKAQRQNRKPSQLPSNISSHDGGSSPQMTASALEALARQGKVQRQNRKPSQLPKTDPLNDGSSPQMSASVLGILGQQGLIQRQSRKPPQPPKVETSGNAFIKGIHAHNVTSVTESEPVLIKEKAKRSMSFPIDEKNIPRGKPLNHQVDIGTCPRSSSLPPSVSINSPKEESVKVTKEHGNELLMAKIPIIPTSNIFAQKRQQSPQCTIDLTNEDATKNITENKVNQFKETNSGISRFKKRPAAKAAKTAQQTSRKKPVPAKKEKNTARTSSLSALPTQKVDSRKNPKCLVNSPEQKLKYFNNGVEVDAEGALMAKKSASNRNKLTVSSPKRSTASAPTELLSEGPSIQANGKALTNSAPIPKAASASLTATTPVSLNMALSSPSLINHIRKSKSSTESSLKKAKQSVTQYNTKKNASFPSTKAPRPSSANSDKSLISSVARANTNMDAPPPLQPNCTHNELISYVQGRVPELTSTLSLLQQRHQKVSNSDLTKMSSGRVHPSIVDAVLSELHKVAETRVPAEVAKSPSASSYCEQLRIRSSNCMRAIEAYKSGEPAQRKDVAPAGIAVSTSSEKNETNKNETNKNETNKNENVNVDFKGTGKPRTDEAQPTPLKSSRVSLKFISRKGDDRLKELQAQQRMVWSSFEDNWDNFGPLPKNIEMPQDLSVKNTEGQDVDKKTGASPTMPTGPHANLMGEIFGNDAKKDDENQNDDQNQNDASNSERNRISMASSEELVKDSLKEREKALSAARALLNFGGGFP